MNEMIDSRVHEILSNVEPVSIGKTKLEMHVMVKPVVIVAAEEDVRRSRI
jgi:hypothetical protein